MATIACTALLVVLVVLAALDLRLGIGADNTLVGQVAAGGEPRQTAGIAAALDQRRKSEFERRLLELAGGGLLLFGVAFAVAWRFARRVEGPIDEMRTAVERLAGGNWATHIEAPAGGYGRELALALERLRMNLSDHAATGRALDIMLDSMNDAVFVTSPDGLIKRVNVAATQLLGWSQAELLGRELAYVISDQDRTTFNIEQAANETLELTVRTRTSTSWRDARFSSRRKSSSGTKYEFVMNRLLWADAMLSARKRSAGVLPVVGDVYNSPASAPSRIGVNPLAGKKMSPVRSSPVASAQADANAAWSCITAGPSNRTFDSRHWSSCRPSPSQ